MIEFNIDDYQKIKNQIAPYLNKIAERSDYFSITSALDQIINAKPLPKPVLYREDSGTYLKTLDEQKAILFRYNKRAVHSKIDDLHLTEKWMEKLIEKYTIWLEAVKSVVEDLVISPEIQEYADEVSSLEKLAKNIGIQLREAFRPSKRFELALSSHWPK